MDAAPIPRSGAYVISLVGAPAAGFFIGFVVAAALVGFAGDFTPSLAFFGLPPLVAGFVAAYACRSAATVSTPRTVVLVLAAMAIAVLLALVIFAVFGHPPSK